MKTAAKTLWTWTWLFALCLFLSTTLSGCITTQGTAAKKTAQSFARAMADEAVDDALYILCQAASRGSLNRAFSQNPSRAEALKTLCAAQDVLMLMEPPHVVAE